MNIRKLLVAAGALAALTIPMLAAPMGAARADAIGKTFLVNTTADGVDANIGDGKCQTASKKCALRAAIQESNSLLGTNTILVPAGLYIIPNTGPDSAGNGDFDITDSVIIRGEGIGKTVLDGNDEYRIFQIAEPNGAVDVTLEQMTIQNGDIGGFNPSGGAIYNDGTLTLEHVVVADSSAKLGGGIANFKTLHMRYSTLTDNYAARGGGLANGAQATADIFSSTISYNDATHGGGIDNYGGALFMVNSTVAHNTALIDGGGIFNFKNAGTSNYLDLRSVTVSRNTADSDVDNLGNGGGIFNQAGATVVVFDTLLAQNVDKSIVIDPVLSHHDCHGELTEGDYGYNLLAVPNGCTGLTNGQKGDKVGTTNAPINAKLNALANNGGMNLTLMPMNDSPAVNAGDPGHCSNDTNGLDQRGFARVVGSNCDLGAVEVGAGCPAKPTTPVRFTPTEGKKTKKTSTRLKWLVSDCAASYKLVVRRDAQNGPKVANVKNLNATEYQVTNLAKGHTYYWRVEACNGNGCVKSAWFTFKVKP